MALDIVNIQNFSPINNGDRQNSHLKPKVSWILIKPKANTISTYKMLMCRLLFYTKIHYPMVSVLSIIAKEHVQDFLMISSYYGSPTTANVANDIDTMNPCLYQWSNTDMEILKPFIEPLSDKLG